MAGHRWLWALCAVLLLAVGVRADDARPAYLEVREIAPGRYQVMWKTPMLGGARLRIAPRFPGEFANVEGTYRRQIVSDALIERWEIRSVDKLELRGREIGVDGLSLTLRDVVVRMQFLDGQRVSAVLRAARSAFVVPDRAGTGRGSLATELRAGVSAGFWHALSGWAHVLLAVALGFAARARGIAAGLGAFLLLHAVGVVVGQATSWSIPMAWVEGMVGVVAALAAREAMLGRVARLGVLCGLAGCAHGIAIAGSSEEGTLALLATSLGIDAAQLGMGALAAIVAALLQTRTVISRLIPFACGTAALALAFVAAASPAVATVDEGPSASGLPVGLTSVPANAPGAVGARPPGLASPLSVYLDVAPFETRLEILGRLPVLDAWLDLGVTKRDVVSVPEQTRVLERVIAVLQTRFETTIDGRAQSAEALRRGFAVTGDVTTGTYLREAPVPEPFETAVVGVVFAYPTPGVPRDVAVTWRELEELGAVPAVMIDPESSRDAQLSASSPVLRWRNDLVEDPLPAVDVVAVRTPTWEVSPLALLLIVVGLVLGGQAVRIRGRDPRAGVGARLALTAACAVAPVWTMSVPALVGGVAVPESREAAAICGSLLRNVYRAFDYRGEEAIYDRLAVSVSGEQLARVYLEHRRGLEIERTGGARARVEAVEVTDVAGLEAAAGGGFAADVAWMVAGSVTHFGHRHLRQNRYRADVTITPADGAWKIEVIELREEERLR